jgi:DNA modification methylase
MIINSDNITALKNYPDNYFDSVVTDPPYGLSFMGKKWDYDVPTIDLWKECLRVLKPGGHLLAFAGTRTQHRMAVRIEDAGFEIRDMIAWVYGSGFPKSHNIGKALNNPDMEGWGTALKPALEPITVARKPLSEKSVADNVLKWGTGGINIDGCRIGYSKDDHLMKYEGYQNGTYKSEYEEGTSYKYGNQVQINPTGRFPANIILDEEAGKIMDEQSGISKSSDTKRNRNTLGSFGMPNDETPEYNDKGGASRFFYVAKASKSERNKGLEGFEEKRSSAYGYEIGLGEKGEGMFKDRNPIKQNFHPTVKPVKLMQYLVRLVTPPNGIVLDPFCGSGTTGIACKLEGFEFVGMEQDAEYSKIAEARIESTKKDLTLF